MTKIDQLQYSICSEVREIHPCRPHALTAAVVWLWIHVSALSQPHATKLKFSVMSYKNVLLIVWVKKRPPGAWSQIRFEPLTAARLPQMARRQSLSLRTVYVRAHESEKRYDNAFIESPWPHWFRRQLDMSRVTVGIHIVIVTFNFNQWQLRWRLRSSRGRECNIWQFNSSSKLGSNEKLRVV